MRYLILFLVSVSCTQKPEYNQLSSPVQIEGIQQETRELNGQYQTVSKPIQIEQLNAPTGKSAEYVEIKNPPKEAVLLK